MRERCKPTSNRMSEWPSTLLVSTHCAVAAVMAKPKGAFIFARVIFLWYSMSTGAVFHERTLHGGFKPQKRIEMLVLGYLLVCHLCAPLRSLILWLARFAALTQSLPSLRKDMSLRLFLTIVRSRCANYRQTSLRTGGQTDGQTLFRWVHK